MKRRGRNLIGLCLKVLLIAGLVALLVRAFAGQPVDWAKMGRLFEGGWGWLAAAQVFIALGLLLTFYRWQVLLKAQEIRYGVLEAFRLGFIGFFFNQFVPGATGGDVLKAYYVAVDHPERRAAGVTTVFLDRVIGLLVLIAIAGVALSLNWDRVSSDPVLRSLTWVVGAGVAGFAVCGGLFFSERCRNHALVQAMMRRMPLRDLAGKVQAAVYIYKSHPALVLWVLAISAAAHSSMAVVAYCYARAMEGGLEGCPTLGSFFFIVPIAHVAMAIPTGSPGGLGQSELAFGELFRRIGYGNGLLLGLIERANWALWALVGCYFYLRRRGQIRHVLDLEAEAAGREEGGLAPAGRAETLDTRP